MNVIVEYFVVEEEYRNVKIILEKICVLEKMYVIVLKYKGMEKFRF